MKVQFHTEIDFNPHGLHENSGVRQWENETLVAIVEYDRNRYCLFELPARATRVQRSKRGFDSIEKAERERDEQYEGRALFVSMADIAEEIERRKQELYSWYLVQDKRYFGTIRASSIEHAKSLLAGSTFGMPEEEEYYVEFAK